MGLFAKSFGKKHRPLLILFLLIGAVHGVGQSSQREASGQSPKLPPTSAMAISGDISVIKDGAGPQPPDPFREAVGFGNAAKEEEIEFTQRFNKLLGALNEFSVIYNKGHVIDVKKVRAVRKAWGDLEKTGWFRVENTKQEPR